ncbi:MAG TPA: succinate--CoA ligase subunit alpha [Tepidisphaeraceae bacterium]
MSILVNKNTRVLTQGITGATGQIHTRACKEYGTQMVGGVVPGKGGTDFEGIPIFDTVELARKATGAHATVIYVPPPFAADAILEAVAAGIELVICITEGVPVLDMVKVKRFMRGSGSRLIGPNCPGLITPGECKIGIMPGYIHLPPDKAKTGKSVGIISRSGTLTYEAVWQCASRGIGQTTAVGIGGDPVKGLNFIELLDLFNKDAATDGIIMIGEIGGSDEADAARWAQKNVKKPIVGFIAGRTAPAGKRMGHAGAIISGGDDTADAKLKVFKECGIHISQSPATIGETMAKALNV